MAKDTFIYSIILIIIAILPVAAQTDLSIPHLEKRGQTTQLIVNGKPYLALAGELGNNTATNIEYMKPIWERLATMNLNTVLPALSWALTEPEEGNFDFTLIDGLIEDARKNNMKLVPLWFGSWKNTWSSYAPEWVKRDYKRFPRVQLANGSGTERLSPFSDANRDADARAFAALMRHIKKVDGNKHTVIMVQVQNEVGVIPDARDHSAVANKAFNGSVPVELLEYLQTNKATLHPELYSRWQASGFKTSGTWQEVFGNDLVTHDLFMAWHYAKYIGKVVEAGKAEYNLPMFVNAALIRDSYAPGQYNSGGPLPHSSDIWRAGGPQIDFLAPDIYFNFKKWADAYVESGDPLFVPEAAGLATGAANVFYAIGHHAAIGFSPFAIEWEASSDNPLAGAYEALSQLTPLILKHQTEGNVEGVTLGDITPSQRFSLGDYTLTVTPSGRRFRGTAQGDQQQPDPSGIFIATGPEEYFIAGAGFSVTFSPNTPGPPIVGLATVEDGCFVDSKWQRRLTLAGDATGQGNQVQLSGSKPSILRVVLYRYE
jgi:hypothetical protein